MHTYDALGPGRFVRDGGGPGRLRAICGVGSLPAGRNQIVKDFLDQTDAEWLWMVDTDMGFAANTVDLLIAAADPVERPVMGGLCFALKKLTMGEFYAEKFAVGPTLYQFLERDDESGFQTVLDYPRDEVVRVSATGAACLLIHRDALIAIRDKHGDAWFDLITHPTGKGGKPRTFSEDLSFCVRLAGIGVAVHVDTSVKTSHYKGGVYLDESEYDRRRAHG
jgi:hypothetical protein